MAIRGRTPVRGPSCSPTPGADRPSTHTTSSNTTQQMARLCAYTLPRRVSEDRVDRLPGDLVHDRVPLGIGDDLTTVGTLPRVPGARQQLANARQRPGASRPPGVQTAAVPQTHDSPEAPPATMRPYPSRIATASTSRIVTPSDSNPKGRGPPCHLPAWAAWRAARDTRSAVRSASAASTLPLMRAIIRPSAVERSSSPLTTVWSRTPYRSCSSMRSSTSRGRRVNRLLE